MPIYEYTCDSCDNITEALQKVSDPPLKKCEYCGGKLAKKISNSTFILKGSGWYVTDYGGKRNGGGDKMNMKGDGGEKSSKAETPKETKSEGASDKPKESKTEKSASAS